MQTMGKLVLWLIGLVQLVVCLTGLLVVGMFKKTTPKPIGKIQKFDWDKAQKDLKSGEHWPPISDHF